MNRFLAKKKARDGIDDGVSSGLQPSATKKGKKGKKGSPVPKPELDLTTALPSSDNFRTSLLMPNLSARFSMLREQNDPNSKLGKASDDSVLQPKRQSRLADFGYSPSGLSDIAEVSSIRGSMRPLDGTSRNASVASGGTDEDSAPGGSVMSRARPGEGNILFGGRQKVYRIAAGQTGSQKNVGRVLYDDDLGLSAFQVARQQKQERVEHEKEGEPKLAFDSGGPVKDPSRSPSPIGSETHRARSSSTNSGPSVTRSSTAATSIASQGGGSPVTFLSASATIPEVAASLERSVTKSKRLYEQGLDKHVHDQQSSAINRLNSLQQPRPSVGKLSTPQLGQAKSASNLNESYNRFNHVYRCASPPPSAPALNIPSFEANRQEKPNGIAQASNFPLSPPMSPLGTTQENSTLSSALQPGDRGKATALGAFNKPKHFDESQYLQRQKQMQSGRETPPLRKGSAPPPTQWPLKDPSTNLEHLDPTFRSKSDSSDVKPQESPMPAPLALSSLRDISSKKHSAFETQAEPRLPAAVKADSPPGTRSGSEDDGSKGRSASRAAASRRRIFEMAPHARMAVPQLEHPALRLRTSDPEKPNTTDIHNDRPLGVKSDESPPSTTPVSIAEANDPAKSEIDSPTLGPNMSNLGGLIHQHLRNPSNVSSVRNSFPPASPTTEEAGIRPESIPDSDAPARSTHSHSNPWDLEDLDGAYPKVTPSTNSSSPLDSEGRDRKLPTADVIFDKRITPPMKRDAEVGDDRPWEEELKKRHVRDFSSETKHEREAFANELVQRQRLIQEKLRSKTEVESRSASPALGGPVMPPPLKGWNKLKSKSSKDSMATKQDTTPPRVLRMNGFINDSFGTAKSTNAIHNANGRAANEAKAEDVPNAFLHGRGHQRSPPRNEFSFGRDTEQDTYHRGDSPGMRRPMYRNGQPLQNADEYGARDRSTSTPPNGHARKRGPGPRRDELERPIRQINSTGTEFGRQALPVKPQPLQVSRSPVEATQRSGLPGEPQAPAPQGGRLRSNSKPSASGYFDNKSLAPISNGSMANGALPAGIVPGSTPLPSPAYTTAGRSRGPSPAPSSPWINQSNYPSPVFPHSPNLTPPLSSASSPVTPAFGANPTPPPSARLPAVPAGAAVRKKSIHKSDISEPTFISTTSVVDTIELPPGASLRNGHVSPPPVPPLNPLRRRVQRIPGFGHSEKSDPAAVQSLSADDSEANAMNRRPRQRLRKISSEGHSLHGTAMQHSKPMMTGGTPAPMPLYTKPTAPPVTVEGGMF